MESRIHFGTGGWRAIIADDFTRANVRLLTAGLCALMKKDGYGGCEILIGYDRRFMSGEAARWAAEVLAGNGFHVLAVDHPIPTPLAMFTVKEKNLPYGMMITASHNPAVYNGIKLFRPVGRDADQEMTDRIEAEMAAIEPVEKEILSVPFEQGLAEGKIREISPDQDYMDSVLAAMRAEPVRKADLRIAVDPLHGVGGPCMKTILNRCFCDTHLLHATRDPLFGGMAPTPTKEALGALSRYVREHKMNLGIGMDGDADRLGVIDEEGNYLHPNKLLVLLYYYLVKYRGWRGPCVRNHSTTHLLDAVAKDFGQTCYEVPVGFKHIEAKMEETGAVIGGESSGGMAVHGHISGKDAIYSAALLIEMLAVTGKSVGELFREITERYGEYHYRETSFAMSESRKRELRTLLYEQKHIPVFAKEVEHVGTEDGLKVYFVDGSWTTCRFSGTEPVLRVCAEAATAEAAEADIKLWQKELGL